MKRTRRCPACQLLVHPSWDLDFMAADREYFDANPEVRSYFRDVFPSEHPFACVGVKWIIVYQIEPGVRLRREVA